MIETESEKHFNEIAKEYDFWKKKNWYYYSNLFDLYNEQVLKDSPVLEIGTGTGDILGFLNPKKGRGIDISEEMIEIAKRKHGAKDNLIFEREDIFSSDKLFPEKNIFLADVLEHVPDMSLFIEQLSRRTEKGGNIVISVANPFWEPLLMVAEKLKMKMPEGPHKRFSIKETEAVFKKSGLIIKKRDFRLLIPKKILFSDWINKRFYNLPIIKNFGFVIFWVLEK